MKLVIVESPAKCKKIEAFLGSGYRVKASFGHIRDLDKGLQAIDVENGFKAKYKITKSKVVSELRKMAKNAEEVIIASDLDREGEAIGFHVAWALKLDPKTTKRIVFNQITKSAIQKSLQEPRTLDYNLFNSQQARRVLDRLVGFELSPLLWRHIKTSLSAGRCQSPAVKLVADREHKIDEFNTESYFETRGEFQDEEGQIELQGVFQNKYQDKIEAEKLLQACITAEFSICKFTKKESSHKPSPPFTTSSLQQEASSKLSISPKICMSIAQKLYEAGKITYMRTDSVELSKEAMGYIAKHVKEKYGEENYQKRIFKTKTKSSQEAHEAIRPVYVDEENLSGFTEIESRLYKLIHQRTIASQMKASKSNVFQIIIDMSNREDVIESKIERLTFLGYLLVYGVELPPPDTMIQFIKEGTKLKYNSISSTQKFTKPLSRYTEASLVKALEKKGIGRPSTFSNLISTIQERGYIIKDSRDGKKMDYAILTLLENKIEETQKTLQFGKDKNKLFMSDIGKIVNQFLNKHFESIMDYNFTSNIEKKLDKIAQGKLQWNQVVGEVYHSFHPKVVELSNKEMKREKHLHKRLLGSNTEGLEVYAYLGKFGPVLQLGNYEEHQKNRFTGIPKEMSIKSITLQQALELLSYPKKIGEKDGEAMYIKKGSYGFYLNWKKINASLKEMTEEEISMLTLKDAEKLLSTKESSIIKTFNKNISIRNGPYGHYIKSGKTNVSIPKNIIIEDLTLEKCKELLQNKKKYSNSVKKKLTKSKIKKTSTSVKKKSKKS